MFIENTTPVKSTVLLGKAVGGYLVTHGIPLLGIQNGKYVFSDTELLKEKLKTLPISLKIKLVMEGGGRVG